MSAADYLFWRELVSSTCPFVATGTFSTLALSLLANLILLGFGAWNLLRLRGHVKASLRNLDEARQLAAEARANSAQIQSSLKWLDNVAADVVPLTENHVHMRWPDDPPYGFRRAP